MKTIVGLYLGGCASVEISHLENISGMSETMTFIYRVPGGYVRPNHIINAWRLVRGNALILC
jgi:hypothetical protein